MKSGNVVYGKNLRGTAVIKNNSSLVYHDKVFTQLYVYSGSSWSSTDTKIETNVHINSNENCLPYIINFSVEGIKSETMLHYLEEKNIYISSGSACAKGKKSHVLTAMGLSDNLINSALRVSFSRYNSKSDIDELVKAVINANNTLAKIK